MEASGDVVGRVDVASDLVADAVNQSVYLLHLHHDLALYLVRLLKLLLKKEEDRLRRQHVHLSLQSFYELEEFTQFCFARFHHPNSKLSNKKL